jgi:peptide/nickel transport system permease protein
MTGGRRFARQRFALAAAVCLAVLALAAALAPWLAPRSPDAVDPHAMLRPPGPGGWLGTDDIGRDVWSRLLHAGRASLLLGLGVAVTSVGLGGGLGALAGYRRGWIDAVVSAAVDALLSIPPLALAMVAAALVPLTPGRLVLVLSLLSWTTVARLVRGQVLTLSGWPLVEAARALGASRARVLARHVLPNTMAPVLVAGTLLVANAILIESALSFLGFGLPPPTATWGGMLHAAQVHVVEAPWLGVFPGAAIFLTVASINLLGEGLRETLDPRLR